MPVWKVILVLLALFSLSWIGIVIGWLSWDQDRFYGNQVLKPDTVFTVLLGLAAGAAILVTGSIVMLQGVSSLPVAAGLGIAAGVMIYMTARIQFRSTL